MTAIEAIVITEANLTVEETKRALAKIAQLDTPEQGGHMAAKKKTKPKTNGTAKSSSGDDKPIERARYDESLPCKLDPVEVPLRAAELAKVIREREETLERKRESNAKFRERIAFLNERLTELAEQVEGKVERRNVECVEYLIPRTNTIRIVRMDTSEIIDEHAASPEDLQQPLFDGAKGDSLDETEDATAPE